MKWTEAFYQHIDRPSWTNREASGLVQLARSMFNTFAKQPNVALTPFDWYAYALPVLGWSKPGDKFKVDTKWQLQPYVASPQLRAALLTMAAELDDAAVPFRLLRDPRGTDAVYRQLAKDAWAAMQALGKGGKPPEELHREWEAQAVPEGGAASAAAAASKGKKTPTKKQPEQLDLPGVPKPEEATIQPVDLPPKKGGGAGWLLLLLALGSKRKRGKRGKR